MIAACLGCDLKFVGYRGVARHWAAQRKNNGPCREGGRSFSFRVMDPKDTTMGSKLCSRCYESENGTGLMCQEHIKEAVDKITAEQAAKHQQANEAWKKSILSMSELIKLANEDRASAEKHAAMLYELVIDRENPLSPATLERFTEIAEIAIKLRADTGKDADRWVPRAAFDKAVADAVDSGLLATALLRERNEARAERDDALNSAAEMEAKANREQGRADTAEKMLMDLRPVIKEAADLFRSYADGHKQRGDTEKMHRNDKAADQLFAALARTEPMAGRWVPMPVSPWLLGLLDCPACHVVWMHWGPTTVQPNGSLSCSGHPCATCEPLGLVGFNRIAVTDFVRRCDAAVAQAEFEHAEMEKQARLAMEWMVAAQTNSQPLVEAKEDLNAIRSAVVGTMAEVGIAMPESGPCSPAEVSAAIRRLASANTVITANHVVSVVEKALEGNHVDYTDERITGAAKKITKLVTDLRAAKFTIKSLEEIELRIIKEKYKLEDSITDLIKQREDVATLIKDAHKAVTGVRP